jgi:bla regulator protein BlaR1
MKLRKLLQVFISALFIISVFVFNTQNANALDIDILKNDFKDVEKLLPQGSEILFKDEENKVPLIVEKDIDASKDEELFVVYRDRNMKDVLFLAVIKKVQEKLVVISTIKGEGYNLDILDFTDMDGDGNQDILFGLKISSEYGRLHSYKVLDSSVEKIFSTTYSKLDIIPQNSYGNKSRQTALALWIKDTGEAYKINIFRWSGKEFIEAKDIYKQYFRKVVAFYEDKVKEVPDAAFYWYYLANAQNKCGLKKEALKSIGKGVSLDAEYPSKQQFEELKRSIK